MGLQAARRIEELAGAGSIARGALGLNGSPSERMCQVAIRTLRATAALAGLALPWRRLMSVSGDAGLMRQPRLQAALPLLPQRSSQGSVGPACPGHWLGSAA